MSAAVAAAPARAVPRALLDAYLTFPLAEPRQSFRLQISLELQTRRAPLAARPVALLVIRVEFVYVSPLVVLHGPLTRYAYVHPVPEDVVRVPREPVDAVIISDLDRHEGSHVVRRQPVSQTAQVDELRVDALAMTVDAPFFVDATLPRLTAEDARANENGVHVSRAHGAPEILQRVALVRRHIRLLHRQDLFDAILHLRAHALGHALPHAERSPLRELEYQLYRTIEVDHRDRSLLFEYFIVRCEPHESRRKMSDLPLMT